MSAGGSAPTAQEAAVLQMAEAIERAIDDEMDRIDEISGDEIAAIRQRRAKQLKDMKDRRDLWMARGHGHYNIIGDAKEFFENMKNSERVICHFGRGATLRCKILDTPFRDLAQKHFETRFMYVDVEKFPALAEKFNVMMLPHVMLVEKQNTFHSIIGFDEFGGKDDFDTDHCADVLKTFGMLNDKDMFAADQTD